ncbi:hypothetical protein Q3G72_022279 [Acer saccharum]|nr:hypothetical protein Q3G72_022279 [Acer saccharum]
MGIAVNLVTYLVGTMHLASATSANIVTDFLGTSFLLCLLGGFLADSFLGRNKTTAIFATVQTLGTGMLATVTKLPQLRPRPCHASATTTCEQANGFQMGILYVALYLIALGTGGLKSSVSGFKTDQFDEKDDKEKAQMSYFFNRFFFFISIGSLMAVTMLVYIQDEVGRSWGYGICSVAMSISILIFFSGSKRYRYKKSSGSPIVHIFQVIAASTRKRKMDLPYNLTMLYEDTPEASRIHHTDPFRFLDKAAIATEGDFDNGSSPNPWKLCLVTRVEEVKMMGRLLPIWATTIIFWTTYAQMITFSVEQATTMERSIGNFQIPAGSLTVFFVAAIMITLAVYDCLIMPLWKKWKGKPVLMEEDFAMFQLFTRLLTLSIRIILGMVKRLFFRVTLVAVNWINRGDVGCLAFVDQIFDIRNWLRLLPSSVVAFISRSSNFLADSLARQGSVNNGDYVRVLDSRTFCILATFPLCVFVFPLCFGVVFAGLFLFFSLALLLLFLLLCPLFLDLMI